MKRYAYPLSFSRAATLWLIFTLGIVVISVGVCFFIGSQWRPTLLSVASIAMSVLVAITTYQCFLNGYFPGSMFVSIETKPIQFWVTVALFFLIAICLFLVGAFSLIAFLLAKFML